MSYLLWALLAYLTYRFIFGFVVPVARATRLMRRQFEQMKQGAETDFQNTKTAQSRFEGDDKQKPRFDVEGEYIPFEEVK
jgi:hypothetical protein